MRVYTITLPVSYHELKPDSLTKVDKKIQCCIIAGCAFRLCVCGVREGVCDLGGLCLETTHGHWVRVHEAHEPSWPPRKAGIVIRAMVVWAFRQFS